MGLIRRSLGLNCIKKSQFTYILSLPAALNVSCNFSISFIYYFEKLHQQVSTQPDLHEKSTLHQSNYWRGLIWLILLSHFPRAFTICNLQQLNSKDKNVNQNLDSETCSYMTSADLQSHEKYFCSKKKVTTSFPWILQNQKIKIKQLVQLDPVYCVDLVTSKVMQDLKVGCLKFNICG